MKIVIVLFVITACLACSHRPETLPIEDSFILNRVNIVDVKNQTILENRSLLIKQGRIAVVSREPMTPQAGVTKIIDGQNGYLTPGLIDMHVHMYEPAAYTLALSHGVTHVRVMNGVPQQLQWREQVERGQLIGSSSSVSSPIISGYEDAYLHHTALTTEQAVDAVKRYRAQGYDLIKAYGNLNKASLEALLNTATEVGIPVAKHGPHGSGDMPVARLTGLQSLEHIEDIYQGPLNYEFAPERLPAISKALNETGVPITPTLAIFNQLTQLSLKKEAFVESLPTDYTSTIISLETKHNQLKRWLTASHKHAAHNQKTLNFLLEITQRFHRAGIPLLVGSDSGVLLSPHGIATHTEMQLLNKAGLSNFEVLAAATINPAKALKLDDELGQIQPGFKADFIYSHDNPIDGLEVLIAPDAVIKQGEWYSKQQLIELRKNAIANRSLWQEFTTLVEAL